MLDHGPTWASVELARRLGALSSGSPLAQFFAAGWGAAAAPDEALQRRPGAAPRAPRSVGA